MQKMLIWLHILLSLNHEPVWVASIHVSELDPQTLSTGARGLTWRCGVGWRKDWRWPAHSCDTSTPHIPRRIQGWWTLSSAWGCTGSAGFPGCLRVKRHREHQETPQRQWVIEWLLHATLDGHLLIFFFTWYLKFSLASWFKHGNVMLPGCLLFLVVSSHSLSLFSLVINYQVACKISHKKIIIHLEVLIKECDAMYWTSEAIFSSLLDIPMRNSSSPWNQHLSKWGRIAWDSRVSSTAPTTATASGTPQA